ncbi:MAG: metal-dependent hydrolase [Rhodobacteraceae bacterium]|nr:metal-dependent hydrolase [Paracoccaceae bacterium]
MRLATYNMRKAIGLDRRRDAGRILDVINALEADVVVLQEADRRLGPRPSALPHALLEGHSDFVPAHLAENHVSLGFHGNAILVRRGIKVAAAKRIDLPGLEPRGAVSVEIGGVLRVVGVHLGLMRRHRRAQIGQIKRALNGVDMPTAILGDFNEWSPYQGLEGLAEGFTLHAPGRSYHAARPVAALDRVALSHGLELRDAGVEEDGQARIASDHLPVWVDVMIEAAPE